MRNAQGHTPLRTRQAVATSAALAAAGLMLCGTSERASATPAGLTFYPATDVYPKGNFHFDADSFGKGVRMDAFTSTGLSYGIGPDTEGAFGRSEVGFDYVVGIGGATPATRASNRLLFNAKTQVYENATNGTRVVAGLWGWGSRRIAAPNYGYLLGSKTFGGGRVHAGVAHAFATRASLITPAGNANRTSLQLGYDRVFANGKLQFTADMYTGKNGYAAFAPGLIYYLNDKAAFQVGWIRYNDASIGTVGPAFTRNQIYLGFDYNFGKTATPEAAPAPPPETAPGAPANQ